MKEWVELIQRVVKPMGKSPVYNCMLSINDEKRMVKYSRAFGTFGENDQLIHPFFRFRIGSITKPFTAAVVLQLMEEGLINLHAPLFDLLDAATTTPLKEISMVEGKNYSHQITPAQLLQHSAGLPDYFADDVSFLDDLIKHPLKSWNWELVMEKYMASGLNYKCLFKPGTGFYYSDTHYLLLAVLIEQVTQKSLHQNYKERILNPLGLSDTYLEFFQCVADSKQEVFPYYGEYSLKNINTSFDWGGGGLMSTINDLDIFIRSLLAGRLFKDELSLKMMLPSAGTTHPADELEKKMWYGYGLQKKVIKECIFYGHRSAYGSLLFFNQENDISIIISLNQAMANHKADWLMNKVINSLDEW